MCFVEEKIELHRFTLPAGAVFLLKKLKKKHAQRFETELLSKIIDQKYQI